MFNTLYTGIASLAATYGGQVWTGGRNHQGASTVQIGVICSENPASQDIDIGLLASTQVAAGSTAVVAAETCFEILTLDSTDTWIASPEGTNWTTVATVALYPYFQWRDGIVTGSTNVYNCYIMEYD
jgi:hypothetical protein